MTTDHISPDELDQMKARLLEQIENIDETELRIVPRTQESLAFYVAGALREIVSFRRYAVSVPTAWKRRFTESLLEGIDPNWRRRWLLRSVGFRIMQRKPTGKDEPRGDLVDCISEGEARRIANFNLLMTLGSALYIQKMTPSLSEPRPMWHIIIAHGGTRERVGELHIDAQTGRDVTWHPDAAAESEVHECGAQKK